MSPTQSKATSKASSKGKGKSKAAATATHTEDVQASHAPLLIPPPPPPPATPASPVVYEDISAIADPDPNTEGTLTKAELSALLVDHLGINRRNAKTMVDTFFELMSDTLIRGEELKLSGFGNFQVRAKNERPGRNPRTGEPVAITPRHVVTFHASAILKEMAQHSTLVPQATRLPLESKRG